MSAIWHCHSLDCGMTLVDNAKPPHVHSRDMVARWHIDGELTRKLRFVKWWEKLCI